MENFLQRISNGSNIFNSNVLLFLFISLISSLISFYAVPYLVNGSISDQQINEGINQVSTTYGGALTFSANEITASLISFFQLLLISTILLIVAYIVKYKIDKRLFKMNKWRDWRFFIYISGISFIIIDIFQKLLLTIGNNIIVSLILTIFSSYLIVIFSAILLPKELPEIKI